MTSEGLASVSCPAEIRARHSTAVAIVSLVGGPRIHRRKVFTRPILFGRGEAGRRSARPVDFAPVATERIDRDKLTVVRGRSASSTRRGF